MLFRSSAVEMITASVIEGAPPAGARLVYVLFDSGIRAGSEVIWSIAVSRRTTCGHLGTEALTRDAILSRS